METRTRNALIALLTVCAFSFYLLLSIGSDIYREAPPLPQTVMDTSGNQVFSYQDIDTGQLAWRSMLLVEPQLQQQLLICRKLPMA